jgi:hypothetical protein
MSIDPTLTPQANLLLVEYRQLRSQDAWHSFLSRLALAGVVVAVVAALFAIPTAKVDAVTQDRNAVASQRDNVGQVANVSADSTLALCLRGDDAAKKLAQSGLCELARQLKAAAAAASTPPKQGAQGVTGQNGRGIAATSIVNGHFQVTYSDGVTEDKGVIKGETGAAGRGITGSTIANGHLTLIYSDATTEDIGQVVGKDGATGQTGETGKPGRGIASTAQVNGDLVVTYTDGTTQDAGPLPKGSDGQPPVGWIEHYADGRTLDCGRVKNFNQQEPHYECTETSPAPPPETTTVTETTSAGLLGGR